MTAELFWLTLATALTAILWVPYVVDRALVRGIPGTLANPSPDAAPLAPWADRVASAHKNTVENLAVFAVLILVANAAGISSGATVLAAQLFFWSRLAYVVIYAIGIPGLRTLAFLGGFAAQVIVVVALFNAAAI